MPEPSAFRLLTDQELEAAAADMSEQVENDNTCDCQNQTRYMLHIEAGCIDVCCAECGKTPWWMQDDFNESVGMDPIMVSAVVTGTEKDYYGEIDGPQVDLTLIKE